MRKYTYDFEIETMVTMFISAMDDIIVKRYNRNKDPKDSLRVRFVYAPKQRVKKTFATITYRFSY